MINGGNDAEGRRAVSFVTRHEFSEVLQEVKDNAVEIAVLRSESKALGDDFKEMRSSLKKMEELLGELVTNKKLFYSLARILVSGFTYAGSFYIVVKGLEDIVKWVLKTL